MNYKMGEERMNEHKITIKDYQRDAFQQLPRVGGEGQMTKNEQAAAYRIAAEYLKTEGFTVYKNLIAKADELDPPALERDPYLVPGAVCEVWDDGETLLKYFSQHDHSNKPRFVPRLDMIGYPGGRHDHYCVIGTPWDHAPDEAEWVATDQNGEIYFYKIKPDVGSSLWEMSTRTCSAGYDAAVESGEIDWRTTLRRRPEWARRDK